MTAPAYTQEAWSLEDLFPGLGAPEISAAEAQLDELVTRFEGCRDALSQALDAKTLGQILEDYDRLTRLESRLLGFASLSFSADTQNQRAQTFLAASRQKLAEIENRTMFFKLWWKALDEASAQPLLDASGDMRYWLEAMRLQSPYTLTEPEERIINLKDVNGVAGLITIYTAITNRYVFDMDVDGEHKQLSRDSLMTYARSPKANLRQSAYQSLFKIYGQEAPVLGQFYQHVVRDWSSENVGVRGYANPMSVRNLANDIPDDVVDMLLEVCRANAGVFQDYFRMKAQWLGLERLRRYDVYAPVTQEESSYSFDLAAQLTLTSFEAFDPGLAEQAKKSSRTITLTAW